MKNKGSKESVSVRYSIKNICKDLGLGKRVLEMFFGLPSQGTRPSKI